MKFANIQQENLPTTTNHYQIINTLKHTEAKHNRQVHNSAEVIQCWHNWNDYKETFERKFLWDKLSVLSFYKTIIIWLTDKCKFSFYYNKEKLDK